MLLTHAELAASAVPNPEVAAALKAMPPPPSGPPEPDKMRQTLDAVERQLLSKLAPSTNVNETYHNITMRDGFRNPAKILKPAGEKEPGPLFILGHAGGFVGGSMEQLTGEARALVQLFGATVINVSYRRAPEHKFPTPQHDVEDACRWITANAAHAAIRADPDKGFILGGVSVGGSMAAALSRKFIDEPLSFSLTGQWLSVASLMDDDCVPDRFKDLFIARKESENTPFLNKASLEALQQWSQWDPRSELRYVVNSKNDISKLPRVYLQVGAMDPYRDDTLIYDEMLKEAGVETKIDLYAGCPHLHMMILPDLEVSKRTRIDTIVGLGWLLGREVSRGDAAVALSLQK